MKKTCKYLCVLLCILVVIIIVQAAYFLTVVPKNNNIEKADLMVVFFGEKERIAAGFQLTKEGYAPYFTITGLTEENFKSYFKKYGDLPSSVEPIISGKSSTTFEDAWNTRLILQKRKFKSVILITSTYHLPRAYFLLRTSLSGMDVKIQRYGVDKKEILDTGSKLKPESSDINVNPNSKERKAQNIEQGDQTLKLKLICNEMIKFWASLGEMMSFRVTGKLLADSPLCFRIRKFLKSKVLFAVN